MWREIHANLHACMLNKAFKQLITHSFCRRMISPIEPDKQRRIECRTLSFGSFQVGFNGSHNIHWNFYDASFVTFAMLDHGDRMPLLWLQVPNVERTAF